jgi:5-methylcytosine-specific restriction endonuclease McrBC regulatory subunit McrC
MITDQMIAEAIENSPRDQYGQIIMMDLQIKRLFPDLDEEEVKKHLETSEMYQLSTYGWKYGTYKAICKRYNK